MPYANHQGVKIYYEVEGQGLPLLFGHGAMGNMSVWRGYGYVDLLKDKYQLILMDARGHGKSDKLYTPNQYHYKLMVDDVIAVLDDLGLEKTHYWGFSMGGSLGFGLAKHYPHRLLSLIIGGASPYKYEADDPNQPNELLVLMRRGVEEGIEVVVEGFRVWAGGAIHPTAEARLRSLDVRAMVALFECSWEGIEDVLPTMTMPCLIYMGDKDEPDYSLSTEYVKQMPNAAHFVLPGLGHAQTSAATDLLVPRALEFLASGK
jgi:pimeloyl-ACP methyl ester carboxylesterase